jgi:uncharacterized protein
MRTLFVDTSFWIAQFDFKDQLHAKALAVENQLSGARIITSELVLIEFLNYFSSGSNKVRQEVRRFLQKSLPVSPHPNPPLGKGREPDFSSFPPWQGGTEGGLATGNILTRNHLSGTVQDILEDPEIKIAWQAQPLFTAGMMLYSTRLDKGYSLTDCVSMVIMRQDGIQEILTHDRHFAQEGFVILL